ncbi:MULTISPECIES: alpha/beta fold hydrolase [unclassified Streptomyces]|uniref:alpha/beta fold hydrolase n=1 Tax=unclassified Streptomyces TaxID=2593676 RepID=UPI002253512E|nr:MULTISPECIES: alpha/beta hydrolase [unclassified Streptomyces]MCX5335952.1 alpha/beta hydrolase [Streptomyces sp. NBC_00140]MCX5366670.1 alpha/beta hydrolase [Streptomyces sp. NBC_00124]
MTTPRNSPSPSTSSYKNAPTRSVSVRGEDFVYRELGPEEGVPLILLIHLAGVLDNWDPRVVDGLAAQRRVITFDNRGVGGSSGSTPATIEAMARDAVLFIRALGFDQVDVFGLSMGGFIAQVIAEKEPRLVRKVILAGTGPAGGPGIDKVPALTIQATLKGALTRQDPKLSLFFTATAGGRQAGRAFLERLKERTHNRDKAISPTSIRAQLKAIKQWGRQAPSDLSKIHQPVLVANGEDDRVVPSRNTLDLAARLPRSELIPLFPDAGHGGIFQYHDQFVANALDFLAS